MNDADLNDVPPLEPVEPSPGADTLFAPFTSHDARAELLASADALPTGFTWLEKNGFRLSPGKLYAVAARPGVGKTAMLLELLIRNAEREPDAGAPLPGPAVFVTYEERRADLYLRLLVRQLYVQEGGFPSRWDDPSKPHWQQLTKPRYMARQWLRNELDVAQPEIANAAKTLDRLTETGRVVLVDGDRDGGDVDLLLDALTAAAAAQGRAPSLVLIDYYQKIRPPSDLRGKGRQEQLQAVADTLRRYAKGELPDSPGPVPVVVGAQVNRLADADGKTSGLPPELAHIREADDLANDAAGVLTLHRGFPHDDEALRVRIVKNRDGVVPTVDPELGTGLKTWTFHGPSGRIHEQGNDAAPAAPTKAEPVMPWDGRRTPGGNAS